MKKGLADNHEHVIKNVPIKSYLMSLKGIPNPPMDTPSQKTRLTLRYYIILNVTVNHQ